VTTGGAAAGGVGRSQPSTRFGALAAFMIVLLPARQNASRVTVIESVYVTLRPTGIGGVWNAVRPLKPVAGLPASSANAGRLLTAGGAP
jgi:hypothetical protein